MISAILRYAAILTVFYLCIRIPSIINSYARWKQHCTECPNTKLYLTWKEFIVTFPFMKDSFYCYSNFLATDFDEHELIFYQKNENEKQVIIFSFIDYLRFKHWERKNVKNMRRSVAQHEKEEYIKTTVAFLQAAQKMTQREGI